jgi:hypothetical protein
MVVSRFGPAPEDIVKRNNLPCVLPDGRGRQFRVRGDVQARLLCGLESTKERTAFIRSKG